MSPEALPVLKAAALLLTVLWVERGYRRRDRRIAGLEAELEREIGAHRGTRTLMLQFSGDYQAEKAETARLRQELTVRAPSDIDLERGVWP